jgi:hypothetical protein
MTSLPPARSGVLPYSLARQGLRHDPLATNAGVYANRDAAPAVEPDGTNRLAEAQIHVDALLDVGERCAGWQRTTGLAGEDRERRRCRGR